MRLLSVLFICLSATLTMPLSAQETSDEYVFRNDIRPEYSKNISVADLSKLQQDQNITLIDVRLTEDFALDPTLIPGATYNTLS
ncbi:MAG: hypothetical protein P8J14_00135 [Emcibacteraceae bacterium]|nr:hypothetical protein [Emcibacteraceae bacterium]